jgi:hypothetical protein
MKVGKDIFTLVREGEKQLRLSPSESAWRKLESRLAARRRRGRMLMVRWLTAAAAMLVLVGGIYFWNASLASQSLGLENTPKPSFIEELSGADNCQPFCLLLKSRKELPEYYANPQRGVN